MQYIDITKTVLRNNKHKYRFIEQQYFIDKDGKKYNVDGKYVVMDSTEREKTVAHMLGNLYGGEIKIIPRVNEPEKIKTPDYVVNNERFDLKEIEGSGKNTLYDAIGKQKRQANNFVFDISKTEISEIEAIRQIKSIYNSNHRKWVDKLILIKKDKILKVYKRG